MDYSLDYSQSHVISSAHQDSINCLSFSPNGTYLASGGDDNTLFVFDYKSGLVLAKVVSTSQVTALLWHPSEDALWVGHANGDIQIIDPLNRTGSNLPITNLEPIECMAFHDSKGLLAVGSRRQVVVLHYSKQRISETFLVIRSPTTPETSSSQEARQIRSVHFVKNGRYLIITYLEHGILCWNLNQNKHEWDLTPRAPRIGRSAVSYDDRYLVISNYYDGFDIYDLENRREHIRTLTAYSMENVSLPVKFVHQGYNNILTGSSHGAVKIFDLDSGRTLHNLPHKGWAMIQALAYYYDPTEGSHFIATGTSEKGIATYLTIWKASAAATETDASPTTGPVGKDRPRRRKLIQFCPKFINIVIILLLSTLLAIMVSYMDIWGIRVHLPSFMILQGLANIRKRSIHHMSVLWPGSLPYSPAHPHTSTAIMTCSSEIESILLNTCPIPT